ncbi:galactose oxidase early set domain-containing protein [Wenjunlia tyrosinilytica]|uniref:Galactose oxidase n=1 Tax=Wenjunlia tyrosinilytica TaxID=1544741 RepID=A0A918DY28_9ACTN|nr:galactose oxidase early set domain-containing protein [Wenjunlia tyrosinilytica]GGO90767.1 hypothetical protein GCM10012280_37050 [Wenjunlia tyrosinilytica]
MRYRTSPQFRKTAFGATAFVAIAAMNAPAASGYVAEKYHHHKINQPGYMARYGHWDVVHVPEPFRVNAIHAALLHTGKVLLIAGSGNKQESFSAGTFKTLLWNPRDNSFRLIHTPDDLFCSGHAQLPGGNLLVAGGTARYEVLAGKVERAAGLMLIKNESPDEGRAFPKGTVFRAPDGREYRAVRGFRLPPAAKRTIRKGRDKGKVKVVASQTRAFVEAVRKGPSQVLDGPAQFGIEGLKGKRARNLYGLAQKLTMATQDYQGIRAAYEFDPVAERYVPVSSMSEARWYPTLVTLKDGRVLAVSGLNDIGQIINGKNEIYDPATRKWSNGPAHYFPTYPALFLTKSGKLFYSGSNSGYGPATKGRVPGLWNPATDTFQPVRGLRDATLTETSASVLLPPAQRQQVMVFGGGGVGESKLTTARTGIVDLNAKDPRYTGGPDLPVGARYLATVLMPNDQVLTSGGSSDYRGRGASDIHRAQFYDPKAGKFIRAADPTVGRNYHSSALLLSDGRVATFGSDPLFADKKNTETGRFEQRIEVFTPPYLYRDGRPALESGPQKLDRGGAGTFRTGNTAGIAAMRLMRPSAVTHSTDVEQRSIELPFTRDAGSVRVTIPENPALVPRGWYMLFAVDKDGTPSQAKWVHVT